MKQGIFCILIHTQVVLVQDVVSGKVWERIFSCVLILCDTEALEATWAPKARAPTIQRQYHEQIA